MFALSWLRLLDVKERQKNKPRRENMTERKLNIENAQT